MPRPYTFFSKRISGRFTIPSGIVMTEVSVLEKIAREIPEIGILTTKSIGLAPREGNREPIYAHCSTHSFINAVGLANPGAEEFARRLSRISIPKDKFLLISIFGADADEFERVAEILAPYADGFELNLSCPHSDTYGQVIGEDSGLVTEIVARVARRKKPVLVKVSPNLDIGTTVRAALMGGAAGFTAINTKGPSPYTIDTFPVLTNIVGGLSGKAIFDSGVQCVKEIRALTDRPIIGCGGIATAKDARAYQHAGAEFLGVGSALTGMDFTDIQQYFAALENDLEHHTDHAERLLKQEYAMRYVKYRVRKNIRLNDEIFLIEIDGEMALAPGQFVFVWIPEKGEKPFSVFDDTPLTFLVRRTGYFTNALANTKEGDHVYLRGPYGNSPRIEGNTLLVGGGTGSAALYLFAKRNKGAVAVLGGRDASSLPYKRFEGVCKKIYAYTEAGDAGKKGRATDDLEDIMAHEKPYACLNCGPEPMVMDAIKKERNYVDEERIFSSIEYLTKCGVGICGRCATRAGYRSCVDGTFLTPEML